MKTLFVVAIGLLLLPLQACATEYSADPITAYVVDAETGKPIEGVVVVAHWQLYGGLHPDRAGELTIMETTTDKSGRFHFPAWGPKPLPEEVSSNARLTYLDPEIMLFKGGYEYTRLTNELTMAALRGEKPPKRQSDWDLKTIRVKRFAKEDIQQRHKSAGFVSNDVGAISRSDCNWRAIPRVIRELTAEDEFFKESGIEHPGIYSIHYLPTNESKCGSVKHFFSGAPR